MSAGACLSPVQPYFSVSVFLCWPLKHTFLYRLCDLALAGVIMVRWQLLFIELRSILIYVGSLSFLYTHCLFSDTFLGFQLVCLLVSFSFSLKLCLIGEEDEHHHLVIEYTFWIQTDHHSFYILFFITSNNAKKYERLWSNIEAHSRKCFSRLPYLRPGTLW